MTAMMRAPALREAWRFTAMAVAASAVIAAASAQPQQTYPDRPIRVVVPLGTGGATDMTARLFGQKLADAVGQQVVIDNRPGAGGIIGADLAAKASPDGYTLLIGSTSHAILPGLHKKLPYDLVKDFAPVSLLVAYPLVLTVHPSVPAKSLKELIALAKAKPGQINYASQGNGSTVHLNAELLKSMAGINLVHVPYKGTAPQIIALLAGEASLGFNTLSGVLSHMKAGRLRALGTTGEKRIPSLPDLPTIVEAGVPGFETGVWAGVLAPAGTPRSIITKLHGEFTRILQFPETKERLAAIDFEPVGNTPEAFGAFIKEEVMKWAKVVKDSGATVD